MVPAQGLFSFITVLTALQPFFPHRFRDVPGAIELVSEMIFLFFSS